MFDKTKAKVEEFKDSFDDLGSSLKTVLYIAVTALAVACVSLLVAFVRTRPVYFPAEATVDA